MSPPTGGLKHLKAERDVQQSESQTLFQSPIAQLAAGSLGFSMNGNQTGCRAEWMTGIGTCEGPVWEGVGRSCVGWGCLNVLCFTLKSPAAASFATPRGSEETTYFVDFVLAG